MGSQVDHIARARAEIAAAKAAGTWRPPTAAQAAMLYAEQSRIREELRLEHAQALAFDQLLKEAA